VKGEEGMGVSEYRGVGVEEGASIDTIGPMCIRVNVLVYRHGGVGFP
jgi:hypothetical protein